MLHRVDTPFTHASLQEETRKERTRVGTSPTATTPPEGVPPRQRYSTSASHFTLKHHATGASTRSRTTSSLFRPSPPLPASFIDASASGRPSRNRSLCRGGNACQYPRSLSDSCATAARGLGDVKECGSGETVTSATAAARERGGGGARCVVAKTTQQSYIRSIKYCVCRK